MRYKRLLSSILTVAMFLSLCGVNAAAADSAVDIVLSDSRITVDGAAISDDPADAVYAGAEIVYYKDGTDETYGEGTAVEKHSAEEAAAHTVVTITQPGTYRLTGALSRGQIAVDLGEDAADNPAAVVTIVLDGVDVTCTVAPALIFYNVYECGVVDVETASATVDTSAAGANVVIAAGSENNFTGSHVARIYKEGTTKKLHKYDGAFYSKMSMSIYGEDGDNSGVLNIVSDNEGLNSELHLTVNGGTIHIESQDDGINTNEDFVSVTTINDGRLTINAGRGAEGDGIDSNGYLVINGGTVWSMSNPSTPDGGIDADCAIVVNGGVVSAFGTRNDAVDNTSLQPYMELSFASTLAAGSEVAVKNESGAVIWSAVTEKKCQSITLTDPALKLNTVYSVYVDGVLQCYNETGLGMMGGGMGGRQPDGTAMPPPDGENMIPPDGMTMPGGMEPGQRPGDGQAPEGMEPGQRPDQMWGDRDPAGEVPPDGMQPGQQGQWPENAGQMPGGMGGGQMASGSGSTEFVLTATQKSFSGICDSDASGKSRVSFTVGGVNRTGSATVIEAITGITPSPDIDPSLVQITVADDPSEDYAASCLLSDGLDAVNALLPAEDGSYIFTVAVVTGADGYTGATQIAFTVGGLPFTDVRPVDSFYEDIKAVYEAGVMVGTSSDQFSPNSSVTRAQAVTVLARLAGAASEETSAFSDVVSGTWYAGYVGWASENGIVMGDGAGHFMPDSVVLADHMELMLTRYAALVGVEYKSTTGFTGELNRGQLASILASLL